MYSKKSFFVEPGTIVKAEPHVAVLCNSGSALRLNA